MPLPSCDCIGQLPTNEKLDAIYCVLNEMVQSGGSGAFLLKAENLADIPDPGAMRGNMALQDRNGMTILASRKMQNGENVRAMVFGDSIAPDMLYADNLGTLRIFQNYIGNAGAAGVGVNSEQIQYFDGSAAYASADWFREYVQVPAASAYEFSLGTPTRGRRFANQVRVAWRAPVGGTATFRIQTCSDADGAGMGTWVDQGGVRTAVASGAEEEVGSATIDLAEGSYRLRVLGVSGTVDIFNMEVSHSLMGGCVINTQNQGSTAFISWGNLSETQRSTFIEATDPDVIFVTFKDSAASMTAALSALQTTLETALAGSYPRDVVILSAFPTVFNNDPQGDADGQAIYEEREATRKWAADNRATHIDLWDLAPANNVFYDGNPGVHLAGNDEYAHFGQLILDRLGWMRYPKAMARFLPAIRQHEKTSFSELANSTTYVEYLRIRSLGAGTYRLRGYFLFSNIGAAGEGGKVQVAFSGTATCRAYRWFRFAQTTGYITNGCEVTPAFGASPVLPIIAQGATALNGGYGYEMEATIVVTNPGDVIVSVAKEAALGSTLYFREGSYIRTEKEP